MIETDCEVEVMSPKQWLDIQIKSIVFSSQSDTEKYLELLDVIKRYMQLKRNCVLKKG